TESTTNLFNFNQNEFQFESFHQFANFHNSAATTNSQFGLSQEFQNYSSQSENMFQQPEFPKFTVNSQINAFAASTSHQLDFGDDLFNSQVFQSQPQIQQQTQEL